MLLLDSYGDLFFFDYSLRLKMDKVPLEYCKEIISAKLWNNYLLYFCSGDEKEQRCLFVCALSNFVTVK